MRTCIDNHHGFLHALNALAACVNSLAIGLESALYLRQIALK